MEAISKIRKNPKAFYSYARKFSKVNCNVGPFLDDMGNPVIDDSEMAEILSRQYEDVFSKPKENMKINNVHQFFNPTDIQDSDIGEKAFNLHFTFEDVKDAIDSLSSSASAGPDGFPAILLKKCKNELCHPLEKIYRVSLDTSKIPQILKNAFIIPIFKSGSRQDPSNYRPVSLTSHLTKTF